MSSKKPSRHSLQKGHVVSNNWLEYRNLQATEGDAEEKENVGHFSRKNKFTSSLFDPFHKRVVIQCHKRSWREKKQNGDWEKMTLRSHSSYSFLQIRWQRSWNVYGGGNLRSKKEKCKLCVHLFCQSPRLKTFCRHVNIIFFIKFTGIEFKKKNHKEYTFLPNLWYIWERQRI